MRRVAAIVLGLAVVVGFVVLATGAGGSSPGGHTYWAELDNAFGLTQGGDLKIAGVRAGKISKIRLDRRTNAALVGFTISQDGFGSLRTDTTCQSRPQSLIGEYYLDCEPGSAPQVLKPGAVIPLTRTQSTIAPDLVQDVFREPYRQRLSIIIGGLGAAVGGNGQNLGQVLDRAVPALSETNKVLDTLYAQNATIKDLITQGDTVLHSLAGNRSDVARFVVSANGAASDTAARRAQLAQGIALLPGFLEQLRPAMVSLGHVTDTNTPALRALDASSAQLKQFFDNLGPFARASTPAFRALGQASVTGSQAVKAAGPTIAQLNQFASGTPELGQNLSIVLQHIDNPAYAIEQDPRAAQQHTDHRANYTGLEALLQYVFDQNISTNGFDTNSHFLGLSLFFSPQCGPYADAAAARNPADVSCHAYLGPTQPGINAPDPTNPGTRSATTTRAAHTKVNSQTAAPAPAATTPSTPSAPAPGAPAPSAPAAPSVNVPGIGPVTVPSLTTQVGKAIGGLLGAPAQGQSAAPAPTQSSSSSTQRGQKSLLDYLLSP